MVHQFRMCGLGGPRPRRFKSELYKTIKKFGKNLCAIKILVEKSAHYIAFLYEPHPMEMMIGDIIEGCPKLKTLTLESLVLEGGSDLFIEKNCLETLSEDGKELEILRIIKGHFWDLFDEKEVKEILPNCNVELKECSFKKRPRVSFYMADSSDTDSD